MKRIVNSPLKLLGSITILIGLITIIFTYGYLLILGLMIIAVGLIPFVIDKRISTGESKWLTKQIAASIIYLVTLAVVWLNWQSHNQIEFKNMEIQSAAIVFGVDGYPELPKSEFWKRKIKIPENGLLITSTKASEISNSIKYEDKANPIDWNPNFSFPCIINKGEIRAWLFTKGNDYSITNDISDLAEVVCINNSTKHHSSESPIWNDKTKGNYLWLQDRNLSRLPSYIDTIDVYKMILTGNNFSSVPKQVINNQNLKELYLSKNKIESLTTSLTNLKDLRLLAINGNKIIDIPNEIVMMENLEVIYLKENNISVNRIEEMKLMNPKLEIK